MCCLLIIVNNELNSLERGRTIEQETIDNDINISNEFEIKEESRENRELTPIDEKKYHRNGGSIIDKNNHNHNHSHNQKGLNGSKRVIFGMFGFAIVVGAVYAGYALFKQHYDQATDTNTNNNNKRE